VRASETGARQTPCLQPPAPLRDCPAVPTTRVYPIAYFFVSNRPSQCNCFFRWYGGPRQGAVSGRVLRLAVPRGVRSEQASPLLRGSVVSPMLREAVGRTQIWLMGRALKAVGRKVGQRGDAIDIHTDSATGVLLNTAPPWRGHDIRSPRPQSETDEPGYFVVTPSKNRSITKSVSTISFITLHHPKNTSVLYHGSPGKSRVWNLHFGESPALLPHPKRKLTGRHFLGPTSKKISNRGSG
jgi:hypothetical protein